jgi:hypothetical protein
MRKSPSICSVLHLDWPDEQLSQLSSTEWQVSINMHVESIGKWVNHLHSGLEEKIKFICMPS